MIKMIDPRFQYLQLEDKINAKILEVLNSGQYVKGSELEAFEKQWAYLHQASGAVGVGNGTDALELALEALNLPKGSEVIVPALTFIATAEAITRVGLEPVFCDVDPENFVMRGEDLERALSPKTKAVIPVHLYGRPCPMDEILKLAKVHDLKIIEDCSQAHLASFEGRPVGSFGDAGTFSFYPSKNLGACGHAGVIITSNQKLLKKLRALGNHGRNSQGEHEIEGRNSQMDELQAAILKCKTSALRGWTLRRQNNAQEYEQELGALSGVGTPGAAAKIDHTYHQYVIKVEPRYRDKLRAFLRKHGIETGIHYPKLLKDYAFYSHCRSSVSDEGAALVESILGLPVHEGLQHSDIKKVSKTLRSFFDGQLGL